MSPAPAPARGVLRPPPIVAGVAFAKLALLLYCATAYGYHRDELYDLARTRHLAWGFLDGPPASIAVLFAASRLYGETLLSVRVLPAIVGTVVVVLTARLARRFGAGTVARGWPRYASWLPRASSPWTTSTRCGRWRSSGGR